MINNIDPEDIIESEDLIEYEMDHTGINCLELIHSNVTNGCDLIYEFIPNDESD